MVALTAHSGYVRASEVIDVTPSFAGVSNIWGSAGPGICGNPREFSDIGRFQGREHVLRISSDNAGVNPAGCFPAFDMLLQGAALPLTGSVAGSFAIAADLWIPASLSDGTTYVSTGLLGGCRMIRGIYFSCSSVRFTTEGGRPRFQDRGVDTSATVRFGAWNSVAFIFGPSENGFQYRLFVNGDDVGGVSTTNNTFWPVSLNIGVYGFDAAGVVQPDFQVHWANAAVVPEVDTASLMGLGLLGVLGWSRRAKRVLARQLKS
jgi:hypothetical protein